jgi:bifunctional DNA-binding transcriptional regulator/antitoxin component of YhaV-PrlF toxin-antitoxin module
MEEIKVVIGKGGRVNIPAEHQRVLGFSEGDEVIVGIEGRALRIESRDEAVRRVQQKVRERFGEGRSLSEELIAERREEARTEELPGGRVRG